MSLQDLVLDALPSKEEELSPREILSASDRRPSHEDLALLAEEVAGGNFDKLPHLAAWLSAMYLHAWPRSVKGVLEVVFRAEEVKEGSRESQEWIENMMKEVAREIRQRSLRDRRNRATSNVSLSLDFLSEVFGEDLLDVLQQSCGVSRPTAQSWLRGRKPRVFSSSKIRSMAETLWTLREECGQDPRLWMNTPLPSGRTPLEIWSASSRSALAAEIREALREEQQKQA